MKQNAKILKFKGKKLETFKEVRAALFAILQDILTGKATITEAKPIHLKIKEQMRELHAQNEKRKP